jgi:nucleotide-binding universal stress UspA family protein
MAAQIARATGATITLIRVADIPWEYFASANVYTPLLTEDLLDVSEIEARAYLEHLRLIPPLKTLHVNIEVVQGLPRASALLEQSTMMDIDLIVMCSHGQRGIKRFILGSIAQQVARHCSMPLLVLREHQESIQSSEHSPQIFPVLVALDGSPRAETALAPAAMLSMALSAPHPGQLHLLRVVQPLSTALFTAQLTVERANQLALEAAEGYLKAVTEKVSQRELINIPLQLSISAWSDEHIAAALVKATAEDIQGHSPWGALALASHGRGDVSRWWFGSITESLLGRVNVPLLVVRQPIPESEDGGDGDLDRKEEARDRSKKKEKKNTSYTVY